MAKKFILKKVTKFSDLEEKLETELPQSDLCLSSNNLIVQFDCNEEEAKKIHVKPGVYTVVHEPSVQLKSTALRNDPLLGSIDNTKKIKNEVNVFFSKLPIYETLGIPKARKILLYSDPGLGKSAAINKCVHDLIESDPGTTAIIWPSSDVNSTEFKNLISLYLEYDAACTKLFIIIEDIGGDETEHVRTRSVDSALLSFLDGIDVTFKLPTFIIATTNYPQNLLSALADRPGRFDQMIELTAPSVKERMELLEFISKRPLTDDEKKAVQSKEADQLSIAHLKEVVTRSMLHDKTIMEVIKEIHQHRVKFKNDFNKDNQISMSNEWDE